VQLQTAVHALAGAAFRINAHARLRR